MVKTYSFYLSCPILIYPMMLQSSLRFSIHPVLFLAACACIVHFMSIIACCLPIFSSNNIFFIFFSLCPVESSMLNQENWRCGRTVSNFRFITMARNSYCFPIAAWSFLQTSSAEIHYLCRRVSVAFGSISYRKLVFFSLILLSRSAHTIMITRSTKQDLSKRVEIILEIRIC